MALANNSLPVPLSPLNSTVESLLATVLTIFFTFSILVLFPRISLNATSAVPDITFAISIAL